MHAVTANTRSKQVKYDIFKKISGTSIDKTVPRSTSVHNANFRGISRFFGVEEENSWVGKECSKIEK